MVAGIIATLPMAGLLVALVRDVNVGTGLFLLGFLLVLAAIVTQGLTIRPGGLEVLIALGLGATLRDILFNVLAAAMAVASSAALGWVRRRTAKPPT